jgi:DNA-binding response OmpR family regulator
MKKLDILKELNVLYVDDDKSACNSLKGILQYYFKEVFIAFNGVEALEVYGKKSCHLLIVDYDMPLMNGYEFLSKIRQENEHITAIIMSSYDDKVKLKNAIRLNLLDYIVKPYELTQLQDLFKEFAKKVMSNSALKIQITHECYYDTIQKYIFCNDKVEKFTSSEIKIFEYFLKNRGKMINYEELLDLINSNSQKSLISIIYKINSKLPLKFIENIRDMGYKVKS